jgi:hypothetical protein
MEALIFALVPILSALVTARLFRHKIARIDMGVAMMAGMVSWLLGPRCMCSDIGDMLAGSLLFTSAFGVGVFLLFLAVCFVWKHIHG